MVSPLVVVLLVVLWDLRRLLRLLRRHLLLLRRHLLLRHHLNLRT